MTDQLSRYQVQVRHFPCAAFSRSCVFSRPE